MWHNWLKNGMMTSGLVVLILGTFATILGFAALVNYSQQCYANPGGFPCVIQYQVALLAPLYPLSTGLITFGLLMAISGTVFAYLGHTKYIKTDPNLSTGKSSA